MPTNENEKDGNVTIKIEYRLRELLRTKEHEHKQMLNHISDPTNANHNKK